jgi:hypothetical protein
MGLVFVREYILFCDVEHYGISYAPELISCIPELPQTLTSSHSRIDGSDIGSETNSAMFNIVE